MSVNCSHEECEHYNSCIAATERERRQDFWTRRRRHLPVDQLGTDPLAWLNGDMPAE